MMRAITSIRTAMTLFVALSVFRTAVASERIVLDVDSEEVLAIPKLMAGEPGPGRRVTVTPAEYAETEVFHTVYLPPEWRPESDRLPIIFEYTGNYFPAAGSTGEPEDAGLGYGLSAGRFIWVSLPYINAAGDDNQVTWWGDESATIEYARRYVPQIIREFCADPGTVFLCGFSRGAIGVNYIGLHDDEIASLWTAFVTHDHFDGVREWRGTTWGSPLPQYRAEALERLQRVDGRPFLVSQNGSSKATEEYIRSSLTTTDGFLFSSISTREALGPFPNRIAIAPHNDRWLLKPSRYRTRTWKWINQVLAD